MNAQEQMALDIRELLKWTVVTSYSRVQETLTSVLSKPSERLVYHLSDGTRSGIAIAQESGVNNVTISTLQNKWTKMGLMKKTEQRYQKAFDLEDFDLEIPEPSMPKAGKPSKGK